MSRFARRLLVALALGAVIASAVSAQATFAGVEVLYNQRVSDLRVVGAMAARSGNSPTMAKSLKNLKVGDVFINEDNSARVVTAVYEEGGRVIIETDEPRPEDVVEDLFVPDFDLQMTQANIASLAPGVSYMGSSRAGDAADLFATGLDAESRAKVDWLETDENVEWLDEDGNPVPITTLRIELPFLDGLMSTENLEKLNKIASAGKTNGAAAGDAGSTGTGTGDTGGTGSGDAGGGGDSGGGDSGGGAEGSVSASGEIGLTGVLRFTLPRVSGGLKMPSLKVSWIMHWWHPPIPKLQFTKGYGRVNVDMAQQFDFRLDGSITISAEVKIPIAMLVIVEPHVQLKFECGLYAKITFDGTITLGLEISEYTYLGAGVQADLVWPFIPVKASAWSNFYLNTAFRPMLTAFAEVTGGIYVGGELSILEIGLAELEGGGGVYVNATGYIEPLGVMGYDTRIGSYGSFDEWILYVQAEAGAFAKITASILFWDKDLYHQRWPFWKWANQWEF